MPNPNELSLEEFNELRHMYSAIDPMEPYVFRDDLIEDHDDLEEIDWLEEEFAQLPASEEMREFYQQEIIFGQ